MILSENLVKKFEDFVAVDSISFSVSSGEVLALLGPNGAGKTTTIRMLTSLMVPTSGLAIVDGYNVVEQPQKVRFSVGVLTENHGLYNRMPAIEYLEFFARLYGLGPDERKIRTSLLLDQFGLSVVSKKRVGEYSKGMRQKLALARSLLHNPAVLLLDEPTSAMDPESARMVRNMIKDLKSKDRTILICTHNLVEAEELADRILIISDGKILESGTPPELRQKLLGSPLFNIQLTSEVINLDKKIYDLVDNVQVSSNSISYTCENPQVSNPLVLQALVAQGFQVLFIHEVPRSLENIYLQAVENGRKNAD